MRILALAATVALAACHPGGSYATGRADTADRGETNGRMLDFVSNKPDGDDWQIRVRGTSLFASYAHEATSDKYGPVNLSDKESRKLWNMVDAVGIPDHKKGKKDEDNGYVELRLREPGDEQHDMFTIYVSRETEDEDVINLATYLQDLVAKYFKEKPNF